jgi:hypothetical protein
MTQLQKWALERRHGAELFVISYLLRVKNSLYAGPVDDEAAETNVLS